MDDPNASMPSKNDRSPAKFKGPIRADQAMDDAGGMTDRKFTDLNAKPAERWSTHAKATAALKEFGPDAKAGASSSVKESGRATIPATGGPRAQ